MTLDIVSMAVKVDATEVQRGTKSLEDLARAGSGAEKSVGSLASSINILGNAVKVAGVAFVGLKLAQLVSESTMLAARFETMGIVMKVAGNNAGYTRAEMEKYSVALQNSGISMLQSRDALTQLATAQIDLSKAQALGRAAQDLAVVGNINSSDAMNRLIHGIKSGQVEILRTLGLNVNFEESYKKLATELHKNVDSLTGQEKALARTNAALAEAKNFAWIYEESMTTAGKAMTSLTRHSDDLKIKIGDIFLPALADAVFIFTDALKAANAEMDKAGSAGTINNIGIGLAGAFRTVYEVVVILSANLAYVFAAIATEIGGIAAQISFIATGDFAGAASIGKQMKIDAEAGRKAVDAFSESILNKNKAVTAGTEVDEDARIKAGAAIREKAEAAAKSAASTAFLESELKKTNSGQIAELEVTLKRLGAYKQTNMVLERKGDLQAQIADLKKPKLTEDEIANNKRLADLENERLNDLARWGDVADPARKYREEMERLEMAYLRGDVSLKEMWANMDILKGKIDALNPGLQKSKELMADILAWDKANGQAQDKQIEQWKDMADPVQKHLDEIEKLQDAMYVYGTISTDVGNKNIALHLEEMKKLREKTDATSEVWKTFMDNTQRNLSTVLYNGFNGTFKGIGELFKQMLLRMAADAAAARIAQAMFGGATALFGTAAVAATAGSKAKDATTGLLTTSTGSLTGMGMAATAAAAAAAVYVVAKYGFGLGNKRENVGGNRLVGQFTREGFSGNRQQDWELDRGAFRSSRSGTDITAVSTAESRALMKTVNDLQRTFDSLGDAIGQSNVRTKQWNVGMNLAGDITNALADGIGNALVPALEAFRDAGENLAQTAKRLTTTFQATNFLIVSMGLSAEDAFGKVGIAGTAARQRLIDSVGTLDEFNQVASFFVSNFLTDAQKTAYSLDIVARTFADLGIAGIETNEQFAALVETNKLLNTAAGDTTAGRLLKVAEAFNNITTEAKKTTDQLLALIKTNTFSSLVDYQRAVGLASVPSAAGAGAGAMIDERTKGLVPIRAKEISAGSDINGLIAKWDAANPFHVVSAVNYRATATERAHPESFGMAGSGKQLTHEQLRTAYIASLTGAATGTNFLPQDMPIMAHQGERIIPRADNQELMSRLRNPSENNEALLSELRSLRQEVANLQAANVSIALNTNRSAKVLERFDGNGLPAEREA